MGEKIGTTKASAKISAVFFYFTLQQLNSYRTTLLVYYNKKNYFVFYHKVNSSYVLLS